MALLCGCRGRLVRVAPTSEGPEHICNSPGMRLDATPSKCSRARRQRARRSARRVAAGRPRFQAHHHASGCLRHVNMSACDESTKGGWGTLGVGVSPSPTCVTATRSRSEQFRSPPEGIERSKFAGDNRCETLCLDPMKGVSVPGHRSHHNPAISREKACPHRPESPLCVFFFSV
jgi:hypothetical protein